jgi:hypothetical protein
MMILTNLFTDYLGNIDNKTVILKIISVLDQSGFKVESYLLNEYITGSKDKWINPQAITPILRGKRVYLSKNLPLDAASGDIWFDIVELTPMILVPRDPDDVKEYSASILSEMTPFVAWTSIHPVYQWQFSAFMNLAKTSTKINQIEPPVTALDLSRITSGNEMVYQNNIIKNEADLYAFWFNKSVVHSSELLHLKKLMPSEFDQIWLDNHMEWLGEYSDSDEGCRFAIKKEDVESEIEENDSSHFGEFFYSKDITFRTSVTTQLGLGKSKSFTWLSEFVSLDLNNAFSRDRKITENLQQLQKLLVNSNELGWAERVELLIKSLENTTNEDKKQVAREGLRFFGGMGSLNDLVLHENGTPLLEENDKLDILRDEIYSELVEISKG